MGASTIVLIDGLVTLAVKLIEVVQEENLLPEDQAKKLAELAARLKETHTAVMAYRPKVV